ncbi:MAG: class I tRNA ligase family protein, partial [Gammaproteobacteria bacterium]|nr:class I tRNA ligase family protein [Gammaproteobacteria bacterium]
AKFRAHGLLIRDGRKMSKSRGNVISPDAIIDEFGADTLRLYLLFLGPYDQIADYQSLGIQGPRGFLNRLWQSVVNAEAGPADAVVERALHRTIKQISEQVPALQFNTAIAAMMEYLNRVRADGRTPRRSELTPLVVMLAPFAPHIAEELYVRLGHNGGVFDAARWPTYDEAKTVESTWELAVQVNGKVRGRIDVPADADEESVVAAAKANENVARYLDGAALRKTIVVPGKLVNLVVG